MQSAKDAANLRQHLDAQITVEHLIQLVKAKELEANEYKRQNEQLRIKLSEYREKGDSLQDLPLTQKSQLLRAKSDPVPTQNKWNSHAEIFVFPDNRNRVFQQTQEPQPLLSPPLSDLSRSMEPENVDMKLLSNKVDIGTEPDTSLNLRSNIPTSWLDPSSASQGCTGVSEQYFKNVLNELVKTKKYLNNLLTHQNQSADKTVELNNMRQEVQQLLFTKKHLERELEEVKEENLRIKTKVSPPHARLARTNDSFELDTRGACIARGTQTDQQMDVTQQLKEDFHFTIYNMVTEKQALKRELDETLASYKSLSTQVLSLSTLMQEETNKNKNMEDGLRRKTLEAKELSQKLCILRQKYEELMAEKNALEKNLALQGSRARHHSQPRSIPSPGATHSPRFHSQDKRHGATPPHEHSKHSQDKHSQDKHSQEKHSQDRRHHTKTPTHSGTPHNATSHSATPCHESTRLSYPEGYRSDHAPVLPESVLEQSHWGRLLTPAAQDVPMNNLSRDDSKLSNLPRPTQLDASTRPAPGAMAGFREECPTCLQVFTSENYYQAHLEKCIE